MQAFGDAGPMGAAGTGEALADDMLEDLGRLAVLLQGVQALAGGSVSLSEDGPLDHIEAMASLMAAKVEDMRNRLAAHVLRGGLLPIVVPPTLATVLAAAE